jgi:hypothetical protein
MRTALLAIVPLSFAVTLAVACGGGKGKGANPPPDATGEPSAAATAEPAPTTTATAAATSEPAPPPKKTAKEIVTSGATFMVSFADSDMKTKATADCEKKNPKKEPEKIDKCMKDAEALVAKQGCRYEKDDKGNWWMIAFDSPKDKEVILSKIQFKIASDAPDKLTVTPEGKDVGTKPMNPLPKEVVIDVPDENTIAMAHPKAGRVVYKKR